MISGAMLGIFISGTLLPWVNGTGALIGGIVSAVFVGWISLGSQLAIARKELTFPMKSFSIEGCDNPTLAVLDNDSVSNFTELLLHVNRSVLWLIFKGCYRQTKQSKALMPLFALELSLFFCTKYHTYTTL